MTAARPTGAELAAMPDRDFAGFIRESGIKTASTLVLAEALHRSGNCAGWQPDGLDGHVRDHEQDAAAILDALVGDGWSLIRADALSEGPWDHAYEADTDGVCKTCGWTGSYAHTAAFYRKWIWPALSPLVRRFVTATPEAELIP